MRKYKLVVFVPISDADKLREAVGAVGAGIIGNYEYCSFSSVGYGRYKGNENSNPIIGKAGNYEKVEEERIEFVVTEDVIQKVISEMKRVHPYEEVAYDVYKLEDF